MSKSNFLRQQSLTWLLIQIRIGLAPWIRIPIQEKSLDPYPDFFKPMRNRKTGKIFTWRIDVVNRVIWKMSKNIESGIASSTQPVLLIRFGFNADPYQAFYLRFLNKKYT